MTDERRQFWADYFDHVGNRMGLRDWRKVILEEPCAEDNGAECYCVEGRKIVNIKLQEKWDEETEEEQRHYTAHELTHPHFDLAVEFARITFWDTFKDSEAKEKMANFMRMLEYGIDGMADIIAPNLPLPAEFEARLAGTQNPKTTHIEWVDVPFTPHPNIDNMIEDTGATTEVPVEASYLATYGPCPQCGVEMTFDTIVTAVVHDEKPTCQSCANRAKVANEVPERFCPRCSASLNERASVATALYTVGYICLDCYRELNEPRPEPGQTFRYDYGDIDFQTTPPLEYNTAPALTLKPYERGANSVCCPNCGEEAKAGDAWYWWDGGLHHRLCEAEPNEEGAPTEPHAEEDNQAKLADEAMRSAPAHVQEAWNGLVNHHGSEAAVAAAFIANSTDYQEELLSTVEEQQQVGLGACVA